MNLADRIQRVRAWLAPHIANVPSSSSYIMELDAITHELQAPTPQLPHPTTVPSNGVPRQDRGRRK